MHNPLKKPYDAALIPGGGLLGSGALPPWVINRLDYAVESEMTDWYIPLSAGTVHKPPVLDEKGFPVIESRVAADYLVSRGVHPAQILIEASSYDTIGNAYFSRVIHVQPRRFRRLLVITSSFHTPRTEEIFRWVYGLDAPAGGFMLDFIAVPDEGMSSEIVAERTARETSSLEKVKMLEKEITTLQQLHEWIFSEHEAYRAGGKPECLSGKILETY